MDGSIRTSTRSLKRLLRNLLTDFVVHSAPHLIDNLHPLLDLRALAGAFPLLAIICSI